MKKLIAVILALVLCLSVSMYGNYHFFYKATTIEMAWLAAEVNLELQQVKLEHRHELYSWATTKDAMELVDYREAIEEANKEQQEKFKEQVEYLEEQIKKLKDQNRAVWGDEGLVDFPNMETLMVFLAEDDTDKLEYFLEGMDEQKWVCADYAFQLMRRAAEKGYRLYPTWIYAMEGYNIVSAHMMCAAVVDKFIPGGNDNGKDRKIVVAVESMTDEITIIGGLHDKDSWIKKWYPFLP